MIWQKPFLILKNCALNKSSIEGHLLPLFLFLPLAAIRQRRLSLIQRNQKLRMKDGERSLIFALTFQTVSGLLAISLSY